MHSNPHNPRAKTQKRLVKCRILLSLRLLRLVGQMMELRRVLKPQHNLGILSGQNQPVLDQIFGQHSLQPNRSHIENFRFNLIPTDDQKLHQLQEMLKINDEVIEEFVHRW